MRDKIIAIMQQINSDFRKRTGIAVSAYPYRTSIAFMGKKFKGKELTGAEIGCFRGENAEYMLKNLNIKKLYLIDPWTPYGGYAESQMTEEYLDDAYRRTLRRIRKFRDKVVLIRKSSGEAQNDIEEQLDFVYIDGNHGYKYVRDDIEVYYRKLSRGGVLAGHDIYFPGVSRAFCEFVVRENLKPQIKIMDWWVVKE